MTLNVTIMISNGVFADIWNYNLDFPSFYVFYGKKETGKYYLIYISAKTEEQYMWYTDLINAANVYKSYFLGELKKFYNKVIK